MRIILADDHKDVRSALRLKLQHHKPDWILGEAGSLETMLNAVHHDCPDLLLLDWEMPLKNNHGQSQGLPEIIQWIRAECSQTKVIALSANPGEQAAALQAGCDGFACKADPPEALWAVIEKNLVNQEQE